MTLPDDGTVRITLRDVYETAQRVEHSVGLLVLGFEQLKSASGDHESRLRAIEADEKAAAVLVAGAAIDKRTTEDHEVRLRGVERKVWSIPSFAVLIGVAALVVSILSIGANRAPAPTSNGARTPITAPAPQTHATSPHTSPTIVRAQSPTTVAQTRQTGTQSPPKTTSPTTSPPAPVVTVPALPVTVPVIDLVSRLTSLASRLP
jgi:hypothetical protein